ncbi:hypothetical protein NMY22_g2752 [Coprinellus aureogranulatus]|nr:hypothetical protein NMY22_g2752 [Coprinellus aureogranulatus]
MSPDLFGKHSEVCWLLPNSHLTMTMHQCLQLPEVFCIICSSLDKTDLFHTALTCRRFTDTALDLLWYELTSLIPLLYTLPEEVLETNGKGEKTIVAPLNISIIERLRNVYAPRIRTLRLHRVDKPDIQPIFLESVSELDVGVLTPNLESLDWYSEWPGQFYFGDTFPFIRLFLSPALKYIGTHLWPHNHAQQEVFASISSQYQHLTELRVSWDLYTTYTDGGACLVSDLCKFNNLRRLTIPNLTPDSMTYMATLPDLHGLYLTDIGPDTIPAPTLPPSRSSFKALKDFRLVSEEIEKLYGIIQRIPSSAPLQLLSISHTARGIHDKWEVDTGGPHYHGLISRWQVAVQIVHDHCSPDTLSSIELKDSNYFDPDGLADDFPRQPDTEDLLEAIDITPLFKFKNLRTVEISFCHGLWLTKDVLQGIPGAWKSVVFMDLSTNYPPYRQPRISLEDVVRLVAACPKLWGLGLNFDAMNNMPTPGKLLLEKPIRRLVHLKVGNSPIVSTEDVTSFLGLHFPRLHKIETWKVGDYGIAPDYSEKWAEVGEGLQQAIINRRLARKEKAEGKGATK